MNDADRAPWLWPRSAYIHVPFCAHHCGYCDFAVVTGVDHQIDLYLEALELEMSALGSPQQVETVFIGGGTPTHLSIRQLERLMGIIAKWLPLSGCREFSIESTPESWNDDKVAVLAAGGVNRVSLGVQSFDEKTLKALERRHGPEHVPRAIDCVRRRIDNVSIDLIFGVPGQTLSDWQCDIESALELTPCHVSTYGLTYEKGTPLWKDREHGRVAPLSEDDELAMYLHALDRLGAAGIEQYEISNHARVGMQCRHNQTYWANFAYFGFGVGAASYVRGRRDLNTRNLTTYLRRVLSHESAVFQSEQLGQLERARETLTVQLRRRSGIDRASYAAQTGLTLDQLAGEPLSRLVELGLIRDDGRSIALTRRGFCVADAVIADLLRS